MTPNEYFNKLTKYDKWYAYEQGQNLWGVREGHWTPFLGGGPQVVHSRPPFITIILSLFHYYLDKVNLNSFYHNF